MRPPRPNRYRTHWAGELRADDVGNQVRVAGWVHRRRDHGGLIFIDVRDRTGLLQLVFRPEEAPEAHAAAGNLRGEDVITVTGELVRRDDGAVNPDLPTGEVEQAGRSLKGQFKHAERIGARAVVIVGDGIEVKDMGSGEQRRAADADEAVGLLKAGAP